ncbi:MAG: hypothetical protein ABSF83_13265 [Nitrososphaerales archaeon]|jgi:hypothetical protein
MKQIATVLGVTVTMALLVVGTVLVVTDATGGGRVSTTQPPGTTAYPSSSKSSSASMPSTSSDDRPSTTSSTSASESSTAYSSGSGDGLQVRLSVNATVVRPGQPFTITASEFNELATTSNVSAADGWAAQGLELGPCGHSYGPDQGPLGVAVYQGRYTVANVSQAQPLGIYGSATCPQYMRLMTGFLFEPMSDLAYVLPSFGDSPTPISGSVTVGLQYANYAGGRPLSPGTYSVVGGDEWGDLVFLYVTVT